MSGKRFTIDNPIPVEGSINFLVTVSSMVNSSGFQQKYGRKYGLALNDWRVLMLVVSRPGVSPTELSELLAIDKMNITRAVQRLLDRKFITAATHPEDGRKLTLTIARRGARMYEAIAPGAWQFHEDLVEEFSEAERLMLRDLLSRLIARGRHLKAASTEEGD